MTDHELEKLATLIAHKMAAGHQCRFTSEEAGELHSLVKLWAKVKDNMVNVLVGSLVLGLLTIAWVGARASLK